jgi:hypothetical protein
MQRVAAGLRPGLKLESSEGSLQALPGLMHRHAVIII